MSKTKNLTKYKIHIRFKINKEINKTSKIILISLIGLLIKLVPNFSLRQLRLNV